MDLWSSRDYHSVLTRARGLGGRGEDRVRGEGRWGSKWSQLDRRGKGKEDEGGRESVRKRGALCTPPERALTCSVARGMQGHCKDRSKAPQVFPLPGPSHPIPPSPAPNSYCSDLQKQSLRGLLAAGISHKPFLSQWPEAAPCLEGWRLPEAGFPEPEMTWGFSF